MLRLLGLGIASMGRSKQVTTRECVRVEISREKMCVVCGVRVEFFAGDDCIYDYLII